MTDDMQVSVDDRRALWALTTRHLRSQTFGAVLLVRAALRANASSIEINTSGDQLRVVDNGVPGVGTRAEELEAVIGALRSPAVPALHALESRFGTDLLVSVATATAATITTADRHVVIEAGVVVKDQHTVSAESNCVQLHRPRSLRKEEKRELAAWLSGPRARIVIDGKLWRAAPTLPDGCFFQRSFRTSGGRGLIAFALQEATSKVTVLARGLWVAQDTRRPQGLPIVAVWDDDHVGAADTALLRARTAVDKANAALLVQVAAEFSRQPRNRQLLLRSMLLRGGPGAALPVAFDDVALFDDERGAFRLSLAELRTRGPLVLGRRHADVIVDSEAAAFLHRGLPGLVKDALPQPRRRWTAVLRQLFR